MKLLLAMRQKLLRDTLSVYLKENIPDAVVVEAATLEQSLNALNGANSPDLVLADDRLAGTDGADVLAALRGAAPTLAIALLSEQVDAREAGPLFEAGAAGLLSRELSGRVLLRALEIMLAGERYVPVSGLFDPPPQSRLAAPGGAGETRPCKDNDASNPLERLTRRERDVLEHLVAGLSNREIAQKLGVKDITISFHLKGLFRKLEAANRTQAAMRAVRLGWAA